MKSTQGKSVCVAPNRRLITTASADAQSILSADRNPAIVVPRTLPL